MQIKRLFLFLMVAVLTACGDDEPPYQPPPLRANARINGSFTTFTVTELRLFLFNNYLRNKIILSRDGGRKIEIDFWGNSKGMYGPLVSDTLPKARYFDGTGYIFESVNGFVNISNYRNKEGQYDVSGTFEFDGELVLPDTILKVKVTEGGFANVKNSI